MRLCAHTVIDLNQEYIIFSYLYQTLFCSILI